MAEFSYTPLLWRRGKVVFSRRDRRPITLSSFILKTIGRLVDLLIRESTLFRSLPPHQHAYRRGYSSETALHSLVGTIEKSLETKAYTMIAFLDIEGAFDNVKFEAIDKAIQKLDVEVCIRDWINSVMNYRRIESLIGNYCIERGVVRGTPQGGVLFLLL